MGGPVEAGRVLAFSGAIFAIAITLLTINLEVRPGLHGAAFTSALHQLLPALGASALIAIMPFRSGCSATTTNGPWPSPSTPWPSSPRWPCSWWCGWT